MKTILHQHTNQTTRNLYTKEMNEQPLHPFGDKWYKNDYILWMEDKLEELLVEESQFETDQHNFIEITKKQAKLRYQ